MKKTFKIFTIGTETICTPNDDYYSRSGDWVSDEIQFLTPCSEEFESEEVAHKEAMTYNVGTKLVILPIYTVVNNPFLSK